MKQITIREMSIISLLIAMQIILTRFFAVETPIVRVSFTFIPLAMCSMIFGPLTGGIAAALADFIGIMLFPKGAFFPGFTISAFLSGMAYGMFLYKKPANIMNYTLAACVVCLIINLGLDTLWLRMLLNQGYMALIPTRVVKCIVMIPVQVIMLKLIWQYVGGYILSNVRHS